MAVAVGLVLATGVAAAAAADLAPCPPERSAPFVATAQALVEADQKDRAEEIYQAVIFRDPTNECAVRGLAALTQQRSAERTVFGRLGDSWERSFTKYVEPAIAPMLALVVIVAVLSALAGLLTGTLTRFAARSGGRRRRAVAEAVGFAVLCAGGVAVVAAAVVLSARSAGWTAVAAAARAWPLPLSLFWCLLLAGLVLCLGGVVLYAAALGRELKLALDVRDHSGAGDLVGAQYLLGRLTALGSEAPKGLRTPENTDVTSLPESAVSILAVSGVARAVVPLLRAVRRPAPWRATVGLADASTVVVTVTRNGKAVPNWTTTLHQLGLPSSPPDADTAGEGAAWPDAAKRYLLTAAAAYVLLEISRVDDVLRRGLCGATRARPMAMRLIASDPSARLDDALADTLLRRALAEDPGSGLALVALLGQRSLQLHQQEAVAAEAGAALDRIDGRGTGYAAMRLRLTYMVAATRLNVLLQRTHTDPPSHAAIYAAKLGAANAAVALVRLLRSRGREAAELRQQVRIIAGYLVLDVNSHVGGDLDVAAWPDAVEQAERWVRATRSSDSVPVPPPLNAAESYARACYECSRQASSDWARRALADLRVAATDMALREWARLDPSLERLRREPRDAEDTVPADYQRIVGDAGVTSFFDLPVFDSRRDAIRALGLRGPRDLVELAPGERAQLEVPAVVLRRWTRIAELALPSGGSPGVPVELLDIVVGLGVESREDLDARLDADPAAWHRRVLAAGSGLAVRPRRQDWAVYAGAGAGT